MADASGPPVPENATAAARRAVRPALRRRFYDSVTTGAPAETAAAEAAGGWSVRLDGKPAATPAGHALAAPKRALGDALAAEWEAQREVIDPAKMPLTRLANSIIDGVAARPGPVAAEVEKFLASDLVCYRAANPRGLVERQASHWDPVLAWAHGALGARFVLAEGVVHVAQPEAALAAARIAIPRDPWRLGAVHAVTTLTGSALIAFALAGGHFSADAAWQAAQVDEDWNMEQWGYDDIALERRAFRFAEFAAAAKVLATLRPELGGTGPHSEIALD